MILDGVGINKSKFGNAVKLAKTPNLDRLKKTYPNSHLKTSGLAVGLPKGQMGGSDVGHTNIGAGRVVYQEFTRISLEIKNGSFNRNKSILMAIENAKISGRALHIMGLVSDGGVHSHQDHLFALLKLAKKQGLKNVYIHAFTDGRDVPASSAVGYIKNLEEKIIEIGIGKLATVCGRYYAMDRDTNWTRTEIAYDALTSGIGIRSNSAEKSIKQSYDNDITDEFIEPIIICENNDEPIAKISDNDSVIFFNYRQDRARQISHAFTDKTFSNFERDVIPKDLCYVAMTEYDPTLKVEVAFKPQDLSNTFGEYISKLGYKQLRIAETEKYAYITYAFNGGEEIEYKAEDRILIPSPKVATFDLLPEMSANEITENILETIKSKSYDIIIINYANGDMVGHTGKLDKAIIAVETVDKCLGQVIELLEKVGGEAIITADHGNCELMIDPKTKEPVTSHTIFDVPVIIVSKRVKKITSGKLCDVAPTMLELMGEKKPIEMTGKSIIRKMEK